MCTIYLTSKRLVPEFRGGSISLDTGLIPGGGDLELSVMQAGLGAESSWEYGRREGGPTQITS